MISKEQKEQIVAQYVEQQEIQDHRKYRSLS